MLNCLSKKFKNQEKYNDGQNCPKKLILAFICVSETSNSIKPPLIVPHFVALAVSYIHTVYQADWLIWDRIKKFVIWKFIWTVLRLLILFILVINWTAVSIDSSLNSIRHTFNWLFAYSWLNIIPNFGHMGKQFTYRVRMGETGCQSTFEVLDGI